MEQVFIEAHTKMAENDAHKQNPGNSQRDTCHLDLTQHDAQGNHQS